ncbi:efflux RND transporter periplasmic adaptor subunit [Massilia suwonensis]|uniref:Efflux RND transporter periplasmic adaptor subunit n=1 Tax=Massilia suwonensis TaxID=648895 RepID=A0ABW0MNF8_9BURK
MATLIRPRWPKAAPFMLLYALLLGACSKQEAGTEPVRPVRVAVLGQAPFQASAEFAGEVRPRYESQLGFRVAGKIAAREVDVGTTVRRGQVLMRLDPQDLRLAASQAQASLRAAETSRDLADADYARYQELRARNFVSESVLDTKRAALRAARAEAEAARAAFQSQANQADYASLRSDVDGVVTGIEAEAGQVVAAGTPVVRVARLDALDVVIGIPEDRVGGLRTGDQVAVRLWAEPEEAIPGRVREVSPAADPATRTYPARIAIPPRSGVRLGMTATAQVAASSGAGLRAPLSSLHYEGARPESGWWSVARCAGCPCRSSARWATTCCWGRACRTARPSSRPASTCCARARRCASCRPTWHAAAIPRWLPAACR